MLKGQHFCKSEGFAIKSVGDFLLPNLENARECFHPFRIKVRWLNAELPFPCGQCLGCRSRMSRQKTSLNQKNTERR